MKMMKFPMIVFDDVDDLVFFDETWYCSQR